MPSTTTKTKRTKRPDARPNGKRRRKEHKAEAEKDRLERVAKNEAKGKIVTVPRLAKLPVVDEHDDVKGGDAATKGQTLRKQSKAPVESRVRALHKILRQIQVLEEKEKNGEKLDDAQKLKVARFDAVISELEELQNVEESESDKDEDDKGESDADEQ